MAGAKEIRSKISSINKTRKITRAMEMVAASKMRKTQDRMRASKPYANNCRTRASQVQVKSAKSFKGGKSGKKCFQIFFIVDEQLHDGWCIVMNGKPSKCCRITPSNAL